MKLTFVQKSSLIISATFLVAPFVASAATVTASSLIAKADGAITERINALNELKTRVDGFKNQTPEMQQSITNVVDTNVTGLTELKTKIDGEASIATLKTESASIYGSFRIYALIIPRGWIVAAADRATVIHGMLGDLSTNLETRISAAQNEGKDVTALQKALGDLKAKNDDVVAKIQSVQSGVASLVPDQGDKTVLASNTAALKAARTQIQSVQQDLKAAQQDAATIIKGLKSMHTRSASSTTTTTTL